MLIFVILLSGANYITRETSRVLDPHYIYYITYIDYTNKGVQFGSRVDTLRSSSLNDRLQ